MMVISIKLDHFHNSRCLPTTKTTTTSLSLSYILIMMTIAIVITIIRLESPLCMEFFLFLAPTTRRNVNKQENKNVKNYGKTLRKTWRIDRIDRIEYNRIE